MSADDKLEHLVFVYGTLKAGEPNHHWMTEQENGKHKFVAKGKTKTKYPLVIASRYNIPYLLDVHGSGNNICGEIYAVDEAKLKHLDVLEDNPKYYTRREETIVREDTGAEVKCIVYFLLRHKDEMLKLDFLSDYSSYGPHGKPYVNCDDIDDPDDIDV